MGSRKSGTAPRQGPMTGSPANAPEQVVSGDADYRARRLVPAGDARSSARAWSRPQVLVALLALAAASCVRADGRTSERTLVEQGRALFTEETFDGNGRVCSTCHEPEQFGTITPAFVQARFAENPADPLFRAIDSDDGLGVSYERLKQHATIRVPMDLPTHESGLSVRMCRAPDVTKVFLNRGNPSMFNAALEDRLMHDGRDGSDLETQARNAVLTHNEPGRDPTPEELAAIAAFQESLFSRDAIRKFLETRAGLGLPPGNTPSEIRGRRFFEPSRGMCGSCHSGPMLNMTSQTHPIVVRSRFEGVAVGAEPDNPNEQVWWCFVDPGTNRVVPGPAGDTLVFNHPAADPGLAIVPGTTTFRRPDGMEVTFDNATASVNAGVALFKIPTLWGVANTAPYFHDNSAKDLGELLDHYNLVFGRLFTAEERTAAGCGPVADQCMSEQDKTDIIAYLQLLAFEPDSGRAPRP